MEGGRSWKEEAWADVRGSITLPPRLLSLVFFLRKGDRSEQAEVQAEQYACLLDAKMCGVGLSYTQIRRWPRSSPPLGRRWSCVYLPTYCAPVTQPMLLGKAASAKVRRA
jgi:hypothetical protein